MIFKLDEAMIVLERTPAILENLLIGLPNSWLHTNEGEGSWTVTEVVAHLTEGERTNWLPRLEMILEEGIGRTFPPFNRNAHLKAAEDRDYPIETILAAFRRERMGSLKKLKALVHSEEQLEAAGLHPDFGVVKARELISTWVVHDLTHMAQIMRIMGGRYRADVGPWIAYLGLLK
ncbi:DinB family protein [Paenibacillus sambharensis]|uniref:DinB family protein n=1 Tax=Paenibacillus sambharensis TaxID=1803190 RepID=A0A2W1M140_9BACL|nr:DinB family protein [Paenibacillus sambharensis]PZD97377.1 DinB family protein [Paenibacillus sambharensis]